MLQEKFHLKMTHYFTVVHEKKSFIKILSKRTKTFLGSRWSVKTLTYRISRYPTGSTSERLSKDKIDAEIKSAFQIWYHVCFIIP